MAILGDIVCAVENKMDKRVGGGTKRERDEREKLPYYILSKTSCSYFFVLKEAIGAVGAFGG
jgi:hypothetical protein